MSRSDWVECSESAACSGKQDWHARQGCSDRCLHHLQQQREQVNFISCIPPYCALLDGSLKYDAHGLSDLGLDDSCRFKKVYKTAYCVPVIKYK